MKEIQFCLWYKLKYSALSNIMLNWFTEEKKMN